MGGPTGWPLHWSFLSILTPDLDFIFFQGKPPYESSVKQPALFSGHIKAPVRRNTGLLISEQDMLWRRRELFVYHLTRLVSLEAILMGTGGMACQRQQHIDIIEYSTMHARLFGSYSVHLCECESPQLPRVLHLFLSQTLITAPCLRSSVFTIVLTFSWCSYKG